MFDFRKYYDVAVEVETTPDLLDNEAYRRTAVSRAYYACYKVSDEFLKKRYPRLYQGFSGKGSHQDLWKLFSLDANLNKMDISQKGSRLKRLRQKADYNGSSEITKNNVKLVNGEAKKILDALADEI